MAKWGKCDFRQLQQLQQNLTKLQSVDMDRFCREAAKELAARLLALVIPRTPVGIYNGKTYVCAPGSTGMMHGGSRVEGKKGGTLRRGWTARTEAEAEGGNGGMNPQECAAKLTVEKAGHNYTVTVINPVHYASYVEFGHATANRKGWVPGHYFLTLSEQELERIAPAVLERKLEKLMREAFNV